MPIISEIGRKHWRLRLLIGSIYLILSLGAVTMVYPFAMMLSISFCSKADHEENRLIPRWFYSEDALYRKYVAAKYLKIEDYNQRHRTGYPDFSYAESLGYSIANLNWPHIVAVPFDLDDPHVRARIDDYNEWKRAFAKEKPVFVTCLFLSNRFENSLNLLLDRYIEFLLDKYGSLEGINDAYRQELSSLRSVTYIGERPTFKTYLPAPGERFRDWDDFKQILVDEDLEYINIAEIENEWGRYLQSLYGTEEKINEVLGLGTRAFFRIPLSFNCPPESVDEREALLREHWVTFAKTRVPLRFLSIENADEDYRLFLGEKYPDLSTLNVMHGSSYASFDEITFPAEISFAGGVTADIYAFIESERVAPGEITIRSARWHWAEFLRGKYGSVEAASAAHSIVHGSWDGVELPRRLPLHLTDFEQDLWREFVAASCPVDYLLDSFDERELQAYLDTHYGSVAAINEAWGTDYERLKDVEVPRSGRVTGAQEEALRAMLARGLKSPFDIRLPEDTPDGLWREFLQAKSGSLEAFNEAIRLYRGWDDVTRPTTEVEWAHFTANRSFFVREFIVTNYREVARFMALHGRAFLNTIILCGSMILAALTVNPMCAYALSRFQLSHSNSILLFLLATMAFPVAVTQIPNFLLLKEFNLLNTYWALILPGLANGYSIFLLKGFFDSLPQELFEAGLIDGASEVQMFHRIALPLTKPVLAVIALGAFTLAYGQFMWAFIVCQNPDYWTIMVFLYDLQQDSSVPLVMASLVLASIPTLLVFLATQRVILRGIVVPQMK